MKTITLHRGDETAIVEAGSPSEASLLAIGFSAAPGKPAKPEEPEIVEAPAVVHSVEHHAKVVRKSKGKAKGKR